MAESTRKKPSSQTRKLSWCCSLTGYPPSPENPVILPKTIHKKADSLSKLSFNSVPNSPLSAKSGLHFVGRIDPRRILSPGRVSPIDSDPTAYPFQEIITEPLHTDRVESAPKSRSESFRGKNDGSLSYSGSGAEACGGVFDVRLNLKGKNGGALVLETSSEVLIANSEVFGGLISEYRKSLGSKSKSSGSNDSDDSLKMCRIEVGDVENLGVFKQTVELMFEEDITKRLVKVGVYRAIDILEVSVGIKFTRGVLSCLKYLEVVPWTEEEEEKLRSLFSVGNFEKTASQDILARLYLSDSVDSQQNLARQLVWSITTCTDANARNELKSLVKGLLCKSSVYEKDQPDLSKEDLYVVCQSCLGSLLTLMKEGFGSGRAEKRENGKPLIERISRQVDNINWLLEILIDRQMGEEFVDMWADQEELLKMHETASPMVRYELSRVSATIFIAMGTRKLHCRAEVRAGLLQAWFRPMLSDFGWLQRCKKGLDMKILEEAMGQTLLTLPLKLQYMLFMDWFSCFSKHGAECPNLSKAFQIWWRRSFLGGSETHAIESR
ncbi:BTB/POZ domain-containing protein At2g13690 [Mercurialis annua]|uniref:BTB/POZ domain-containing protein At2g13690 n=1 Tax=Mercurialis annua TaxID=3986 RepID=UPI00215FD2F9|nr:BTB/POZ domain-containing protein At2g13690 [Mercurialis annua]